MKEFEFRNWLNIKYQRSTATSRLVNCKNVETYEGDLDKHFDFDKGQSLINRLTYSTNDQRNNLPAKHKIPINGNIRTGSSTLKQAFKLYMDFRNGVEPSLVSQNSSLSGYNRQKTKKTKYEWPEWTGPSDDDLYELVKLNARFAKFLHPEIVQAMMEDNNKNWAIWRANLKLKKIDPDIYLWHKSPCAFPGVRRYSGSKEIAYFRKHTELKDGNIPDALKLDDNDFPKHLWSFILRGKYFQKFGPKGFALAHLADHKDNNSRMYQEFNVVDPNNTTPIYGLYTAPTNAVFLPTSLIRPSDFSPLIRKILIERANELYGGFCNILPPNIQFKKEKDTKWHYSNFDWSEPVGNLKNMEAFLSYRKEKLRNM